MPGRIYLQGRRLEPWSDFQWLKLPKRRKPSIKQLPKRMVCFFLYIYFNENKLTTDIYVYLEEADDFEDEVVEPEPEPEHSSLANMLNNDEEDEYGYGYDEEY